jgi:uncharacterized protein
MDRRTFIKRSAAVSGLAFAGPFQGLTARAATGSPLSRIPGYGPLVLKGDLWLPAEFNYQVISRQGSRMSDGQLTPGIFDGMGAFRGFPGRTILIRNHENRELDGETKVVTGKHEYDAETWGGNTKLEIKRTPEGRDPLTGQMLYTYKVVRDFAIVGGTTTNCAGGNVGRSWVTCEEAVKGPTATGTLYAPKRHGYIFEVPVDANVPIDPVPVKAAGRFVHEAVSWVDGMLYMTEDRRRLKDTVGNLGEFGGCFYRYIPENFRPDDGDGDEGGDGVPLTVPRLAQTRGKLQALKLRNEWHANMEDGRPVGVAYPVEWVDILDPDHNDDTDNRIDRKPGFISTRLQAQDQGAAWFEKMEGMFAEWPNGNDDDGPRKVFFVCSGATLPNMGAVWMYDPVSQTLTKLYESPGEQDLQNPDNVVVVPQTGNLLICEDGPNDSAQFIRGLTQDGEIYDFCQTTEANVTEFAGACFDPDGHTLYVSQQGEREGLPQGLPQKSAVTYAIYGPFGKLLNRG